MPPKATRGSGRGAAVVATARDGGKGTKLQIRQPTEYANIYNYLKTGQLPETLQGTGARTRRFKFISKAKFFKLKKDDAGGESASDAGAQEKLYLCRTNGREVPMVPAYEIEHARESVMEIHREKGHGDRQKTFDEVRTGIARQ